VIFILQGEVIGVLDIDDTSVEAFGKDDKDGFEKVIHALVASCDWNELLSK